MQRVNFEIFVISLPGSPRFQLLRDQLNSQGASYEVIKAVDGRQISDVELEREVDQRSCLARLGYQIGRPLIGCALSHRKAYLRFLSSNAQWAVVFEEDVRLQPEFESKLDSILSDLDFEAPTIVQLFTRGERFVTRKSQRDLQDSYSLFQFAAIPGQAAAYLINRSAAELALSAKRVDGPSDWPNWASRVNFFSVYPFLSSESAEGTTIGSPTTTRVKFWIRAIQIITGLHWVKYRDSFDSFYDYRILIVQPIYIRTKWVLAGRKTFPIGDAGGLWLL